MSAANPLPEITLDELERLIRMLGMMGSASDSEALVAARFAVKWVREHDTDWKTLLTPEPEPGVSAVVAVEDDAVMARAMEAERVQAYQNGYHAGLRAMAQQVKAQATYAAGQQAAQTAAGQSAGWSNFNPYVAGLGAGLGGSGFQPGVGGGQQAAAAQAAPGGSPAGLQGGPQRPRRWQDVCKELLDRAQSIPGIFRGPKEQTFVTDVLTRGFPTLTAAQETWLRDIAGRNGLSW